MSFSSKRRAWLGSLRRFLRRRRGPRSSDQEWLRLILLVRKLQRGQFAFFQRFEDVRALTGSLHTFRESFGELQDDFIAAQQSLVQLEQGLARGLEKVAPAPGSPEQERAFDKRLDRLETMAGLLEEQSRHATSSPHAAELGAALAYLQELSARYEAIAARLDAIQLPEPPAAAKGWSAVDGRPAGDSAPESQLAALRAELDQARLARAELEAKLQQEMTELAEYAHKKQQRLEDDLRTKKRGLSELTQQNIALQNEVNQLKTELERTRTTGAADAEPRPAKSATNKGSILSKLMNPEQREG